MEADLKNMLVDISEWQKRIELKVDGLESKVDGLESKLDGLEIVVNKNTIKLESMEKKIDIIAEVQTAHKEQTARMIEEDSKYLSEKLDIVEIATRRISSDVNES